MSAILLGAALKEEIKRIKSSTADPRPVGEIDAAFEKEYQDWMFARPPEAEWFLLKPDHSIDAEGLLKELKAADSSAIAGCLLKKFSPALQERFKTGRFDKWLNAVLIREINDLLETSAQLFPKELQARLSRTDKKELLRLKTILKGLANEETAGPETKQTATNPPKPDPYHEALYKQLSPALRYALKHEDFEQSELEMVMSELNGLLLKEERLFCPDVEKKLLPDNQPGNPRGEGPEERILKDDGIEKTQLARNRLWLQIAFPTQVAKVWDTLPVLYAWMHSHEPRNALCLSGGGNS